MLDKRFAFDILSGEVKIMADVHFGVKIPSDLKKTLVDYCIKDGIKIKTFVKNALIEKLEKVGRYGTSSKSSKRS